MAGNVHPAPAHSTHSRSLDAITLLRANGKLLAAADLDAVVGAAREILGGLVPDAEIRRCARGVGRRSPPAPSDNNCRSRFPGGRSSSLPCRGTAAGSHC